jgi:hypothetical protein
MKGKQIESLEELNIAADRHKSVIVPKYHSWEKPKPAVFMLMQQGIVLLKLFRVGMFIYEKEPKTKKTKPMTWQIKEREDQNDN